MRSSVRWRLHGGEMGKEGQSGALGERCNGPHSLYTGPEQGWPTKIISDDYLVSHGGSRQPEDMKVWVATA